MPKHEPEVVAAGQPEMLNSDRARISVLGVMGPEVMRYLEDVSDAHQKLCRDLKTNHPEMSGVDFIEKVIEASMAAAVSMSSTLARDQVSLALILSLVLAKAEKGVAGVFYNSTEIIRQSDEDRAVRKRRGR